VLTIILAVIHDKTANVRLYQEQNISIIDIITHCND